VCSQVNARQQRDARVQRTGRTGRTRTVELWRGWATKRTVNRRMSRRTSGTRGSPRSAGCEIYTSVSWHLYGRLCHPRIHHAPQPPEREYFLFFALVCLAAHSSSIGFQLNAYSDIHMLAPFIPNPSLLRTSLASKSFNPSFLSSLNTKRGTKQTHATGAQYRGTKWSGNYIPCVR